MDLGDGPNSPAWKRTKRTIGTVLFFLGVIVFLNGGVDGLICVGLVMSAGGLFFYFI